MQFRKLGFHIFFFQNNLKILWIWRIESIQNTPSTDLRPSEHPNYHYYTGKKNHELGTILGGGPIRFLLNGS